MSVIPTPLDKAEDTRRSAGAQAIGLLRVLLKRGMVPLHDMPLAEKIVKQWDDSVEEFNQLVEKMDLQGTTTGRISSKKPNFKEVDREG